MNGKNDMFYLISAGNHAHGSVFRVLLVEITDHKAVLKTEKSNTCRLLKSRDIRTKGQKLKNAFNVISSLEGIHASS